MNIIILMVSVISLNAVTWIILLALNARIILMTSAIGKTATNVAVSITMKSSSRKRRKKKRSKVLVPPREWG